MQGKKITKKQWDSFLEALSTTLGLIGATCEKTGISRWVYYDHRKKDEEFARRADEVICNQTGIPFARDKVMEAIYRGEAWAIKYYLSCKDPEFKPQSRYEIETTQQIEQTTEICPMIKRALKLWREDYDRMNRGEEPLIPLTPEEIKDLEEWNNKKKSE